MGTLPKPLSNDELNAIRAKAQAAQNQQAKPATAEDVGYETGIRSLIPIVKRIEALEATMKDMADRVEKLLALGTPEVGAVVGTNTASTRQVVVKDIR